MTVGRLSRLKSPVATVAQRGGVQRRTPTERRPNPGRWLLSWQVRSTKIQGARPAAPTIREPRAEKHEADRDDEGTVQAVGPHDQLYAACEEYRKMVDLQRLEDEVGGGNA